MVLSRQSVLTRKERKCKKKASQRGTVDSESKRLNARQTDEIWFNLQPILVKCSVCASTHLLSVCDRWMFIGPSRNNLYFNNSSHDCNTHDLNSHDIHYQQISVHSQHAPETIRLPIHCLTHHTALSHYIESIAKMFCVFLSLSLNNHVTHASLSCLYSPLCTPSSSIATHFSRRCFPISHSPIHTLNQVRYCPNQCYLIVRIRQVIIHTSLSMPLVDGAW